MRLGGKATVVMMAALLSVAHTVMAQEDSVVSSDTVIMRTLDRVSGRVEDVEMRAGQGYAIHDGHLSAVLTECRYHSDDPSGEAYAFIEVIDTVRGTSVFGGWMMASSPALNALEDARYDLWPLRCKTS